MAATSNNADNPTPTTKTEEAATAGGGGGATANANVDITIYSMPGSQFTGKVLAALDSRNIPHYSVFVPMQLEARKKFLPSGGTLVPEMKVTTGASGGDPTIVPDSEAILHWLDDNKGTKFFPTPEVGELSVRASSKVLTGAVWYYNWVDEAGYKRSMQKSLVRGIMPKFFPETLSGYIINWFVGSTRTKFRQSTIQAMSLEGENEKQLEDSSHIEKLLVEELEYFQSTLTDTEPYLLGQKESTAADFSVYAQIERLVGDMGDGNIPPSFPSLKTETSTKLEKFWNWHDTMRQNFPIKFKGKRPPKKDTDVSATGCM